MLKNFQLGEFERSQVGRPLRPFCPVESASKIEGIDLKALLQRGKKLILLDVDNTITLWRSEEFSDSVLQWISEAKALGLKLTFISNTRHPERLKRISERLGIDVAEGRMKPSRSMFKAALLKSNLNAEQAVMIGDQLMTDIFGANRAGIDAIWLLPLGKKEFTLTKINRWIESRIAIALYNALKRPIDSNDDPELIVNEKSVPSKHRALASQFIKFCVVGVTSTLITLILSVLLINIIRINGVLLSESLGIWLQSHIPVIFNPNKNPTSASSPIMYGIANFTAMMNSFIWNRYWTFEIRGKEERMAQLRKFYVVSISVWILNSLIAGWILNQFATHSSRNVIISQLIASAFMMFVNFGGQRLYAFKPKANS